jgi:RNA polymerase sigma-70 factor (ECF subfamily)
MRAAFGAARASQVERKMFTSEWRQGAETPALVPDQPLGEVPSCGLAPADPVADGDVVYAVYAATGPAARNGKADRHFVKENVSDELLLKNVADGDKAAMHIMFVRYRETVFRFIQRIVRNSAIAEDLVSQVFLAVWQSANRFENRSRVSTWLLSIARFKALNALRGPTCVSVEEGNVLEIADAADMPDVALDRKKTGATLRECIAMLSPTHREIIDLIYYREKSVTEASELIGVPHATVKSRMFYARKQLARILISVGFEVEAIQASVHRTRSAIDREFYPHRSMPTQGREAACLT